ncbi:MAG: type 4a pilus minor pilin PilE [Aquirhabdus sp.]
MRANKVRGFTLLEILIAMAVAGVLVVFAAPSYQRYVIREKRTDLQTNMVQIAQKLEAYKLANNDYNTTLSNAAIYGSAVFPQSGTALYDLNLDTTTVAGSWTLTATPKGGATQAGDGSVLLNDQGWRCWTKTTTPCTLSVTSSWDAH